MSRMEKLNQLFKREVGNMLLLGDVSDPRLKMVTITYADVSKDLSWAHIGYSVLTDNQATINAAQAGLNSATARIRRLLSERVEVRYMPQLKFVYDSRIVSSIKMAETFEAIRKEREQRGTESPEIEQGNDEADSKE